MSAKVILVLCAQALFIQTAISSCLGRGAVGCGWTGNDLIGNGWIGNGLVGNGCAGNWGNNALISDGIIGNGLIGNGYAGNWANNGLIGNGCAALKVIPTSGGGLSVSSVSAIAPSGLSVVSENVYEGSLCVTGELPFESAVALECVLPSAGAGGVSYSCGNGITAIDGTAPFAAAYGAGGAYGLGAGYGPGAGLELGYGARGCGCGCN